MRVLVTWLSPKKFEVGHVLTNVFGRNIGEITAIELVGGYYKVEAKLDEDLPMEVVLASETKRVRKNE
jgi:hypothetical protein